MKNRLLYLLVLLTISTATQAQTSISLTPTESFLTGKPGSTVSQEYVVFNDGAAPYLLACSFEDVWYEGEKTISGDLGSQKERQAGYNVQCSPNRILVPPKFAQKIKVVGLIPKDQDGERYTRFYAQMLPPSELKENQGVHAMIGYSAKVGAMLTLIADGTQKQSADISDVKIEVTKKFHNLQFKMKNTGNIHVGGAGTMVITDATEQMVEKIDAPVPFLYPGQTKSISINLTEKLKPGKYKGLLSVAGTGKEAVFVKEFQIEFVK